MSGSHAEAAAIRESTLAIIAAMTQRKNLVSIFSAACRCKPLPEIACLLHLSAKTIAVYPLADPPEMAITGGVVLERLAPDFDVV